MTTIYGLSVGLRFNGSFDGLKAWMFTMYVDSRCECVAQYWPEMGRATRAGFDVVATI